MVVITDVCWVLSVLLLKTKSMARRILIYNRLSLSKHGEAGHESKKDFVYLGVYSVCEHDGPCTRDCAKDTISSK
jgi:hypothetical protein